MASDDGNMDKKLDCLPSSRNSIRLTQLAVQKVIDVMQHSIKRMDTFITKEICKVATNSNNLTISTTTTIPGTSGSLASGIEGDIESMASSSAPHTPIKKPTVNTCSVDPRALRKAATNMLEARTYLLKTLKHELHPFLMKHVIARAVNDRTVQLVRLAIENNVQVLDFRALEYWLCRSEVPKHLAVCPLGSSASLENTPSEMSLTNLTPSSSDTSAAWTASNSSTFSSDSKYLNFPTGFFTPPNEFDWFSRDKMGQILSFSEACELFSIIKMADCADQLQGLYMNAKRVTYFAASLEAMSFITDTLVGLQSLKKLVIRGMCDDDMLKLIGKNINQLQHLDVSGSQFVTDIGIQHLFFKERNENSALYLISAWIVKNKDKMNPCTHTLTFLDYSWTCVTSMGRKMVQLLPGSYLFKRLMSSRADQDSFAHHIFIREPACMQDIIPAKFDTNSTKIFEKHLVQHVGMKGVKSFLKLVEFHPWRNFVLTLYTLKNADDNSLWKTSAFGNIPPKHDSVKHKKHCYGIITPNQSEKRIQGIVYWNDEVLAQVYTIFPVNINTLGLLSHLTIYRGILNEIWRMQSSLLPGLIHLDIFAEPATFINIIESCPSLRRLRVRIRKHIITDDQIIKAIQNSMCRRTLEDIWIAPGNVVENNRVHTLKNNEDDNKSIKGVDSTTTKGNSSSVSSFNTSSSVQKSTSKEKIQQSSSPSIDLVQLSLQSIDALIGACQRLKRLGDVSMWSEVEAEELYIYCEQLKLKRSNILVIWANMNLPNYTKSRVQHAFNSNNNIHVPNPPQES